MTTSQVETAANRGDLATGDFQIGTVLRRKAVPRFLEDVGRIGWRRRYAAITLPAGSRQVDLPVDYSELSGIYPEDLEYIGEDDGRVLLAETNTTPGTPAGYWLVASDTPGRTAIRFDAPASSSFSFRIAYFYAIPFAADDTVIDFAAWIPAQFHWALVELLRREIYFDRFGEGDARFVMADKEYQWWLERIATKREMARRNRSPVVR